MPGKIANTYRAFVGIPRRYSTLGKSNPNKEAESNAPIASIEKVRLIYGVLSDFDEAIN